MSFKDHFSRQSQDYARARPVYPPELFRFAATLPAGRDLAWDCGTGSGQAAVPLAGHFARVLATDASAAQVTRAKRSAGVTYAVAAAEHPPLRNASVDLVTVAQALHWFDFDAFFAAVRRVARPGGAFLAWGYGHCRIGPEVDAVYGRFYGDVVGSYWPPERRHIEESYRNIPMPFPALPAPAFAMEVRWDLAAYLAYLGTWSSTQRYKEAKGSDPLDIVRADMERAWGDPAQAKTASFPLSMLAGRVE
jgi:SAM-dependent methyltransferase